MDRTCALESILLIYDTTPIGGAVGPVTVTGSLGVINAKMLSGRVIHQLEAKGTPFIYVGYSPIDIGNLICLISSLALKQVQHWLWPTWPV